MWSLVEALSVVRDVIVKEGMSATSVENVLVRRRLNVQCARQQERQRIEKKTAYAKPNFDQKSNRNYQEAKTLSAKIKSKFDIENRQKSCIVIGMFTTVYVKSLSNILFLNLSLSLSLSLCVCVSLLLL